MTCTAWIPVAGLTRPEGDPLQRLGLDPAGGPPIPELQRRTLPIEDSLTRAQLDDVGVLGVGVDDPAVGDRRLQQLEQEPVVVARQPEALALVSAEVHEELERADAQVGDVVRDRVELLAGADAEVEPEVDGGIGFHGASGDRKHVVVGLGRHQVGDQRRDSTRRRGRGLGPHLVGRARQRDVVAEVHVGVDDTGQHVPPADVERLGGRPLRVRCQHSGDPPTVDQQIGSLGAAGEDDRPAGDPEIDGVGHDAYLASSWS